VSAEQDRIRRDPNLTAEQKNIELKRIELEQLKANTLATGQDLPPEPATATTAPAPDPQRTYNIRSGDTEALIALRYGLPVTSIRMANPGVDFNRLKAGQALNIPSSPPPLPPPPFLAFPPP
jgi:LysM repeat protein